MNFALDVTYHVNRVELHVTQQVTSVHRQAGGKGVNVARTLAQLGCDVTVTGLAGGSAGGAARAELARAGLRDETVAIAGESRTALIVVDEGGATGFSEPGPEVSPAEITAFVERYAQLLDQAQAVVLSGRLPVGVPLDIYGRLTTLARDRGLPVLVDTHGRPLREAIAAGPDIVKINAAELATIYPDRDLAGGAAALRADGAGAALISDGPNGIVAATGEGAWRAEPPRALRGNPTGAGDAASAALIAGAVDGQPWPERLASAVALSAAAVHAPHAGAFDEATFRELAATIAVQPLWELRSTL